MRWKCWEHLLHLRVHKWKACLAHLMVAGRFEYDVSTYEFMNHTIQIPIIVIVAKYAIDRSLGPFVCQATIISKVWLVVVLSFLNNVFVIIVMQINDNDMEKFNVSNVRKTLALLRSKWYMHCPLHPINLSTPLDEGMSLCDFALQFVMTHHEKRHCKK